MFGQPWLAQKPWGVPIPGTTKLHRLENLGAADIALTHDGLREIDSTASKIAVQGAGTPNRKNDRPAAKYAESEPLPLNGYNGMKLCETAVPQQGSSPAALYLLIERHPRRHPWSLLLQRQYDCRLVADARGADL
jgi:hypothetical protein